jgi:IS1 family transposase
MEIVGDIWTFTAICPETKLIIGHCIGKRTKENAQQLMTTVRNRTNNRIRYVTTDGNEMYEFLIKHVFGKYIPGSKQRKLPRGFCYAQVIKHIQKNRCVKVERKLIYGNTKTLERRIAESKVSSSINTAFVERSNLTLRQHNKRVGRKTLGYSKVKEYLRWHNTLVIAYYNFCLAHSSLQYYNGDKTVSVTPAMAAGVTDHVWSIEELLNFRLFST